MTDMGLKDMSKEESVSRATDKWKQRVREVCRSC